MTDRYIIINEPGIVNFTARAVLPDGKIITTEKQVVATTNPGRQTVCYTTVIGVSNVQTNSADACSQQRFVNVYYVGQPQNTVYASQDCQVIAPNGYYKIDTNEWINVTGGRIAGRATCAPSTDTTQTPQTIIPETPVVTQTTTVISGEGLVKKQTFTEPSTSTVPIIPVYTQPVIQSSNEPTTPTAVSTEFQGRNSFSDVDTI